MGTKLGRWLLVTGLGVAALSPTLGAAATPKAPKLSMRADNFRFCLMTAAQCLPTDSGNVVTVTPGTTVTWTYTDTACDAVLPCPGHNVRFGATGGKTIKKDHVTLYRRTFTKPGRYAYQCAIHASVGMTGVIVVGSSAPAPPPPKSNPPPTAPALPTPYPYY